MNRIMIAAAVVLAGLAGAFAETNTVEGVKETPEARRYRLRGGDIERPNSFKGKVALVSTQDKVAFANVEAVAKLLAEATGCNIVAEKSAAGKAPDILKANGAQVVVVVVDDAETPAMLLAPEDHWGVVNVAKLTGDLPSENAKARFLDSRARKEIVRAFSILCGGGSSQFPGNMMNAATMKELDLTVDSIPVDMIQFYQTYLKSVGVTVRSVTNYRTACQEGWAPQPTNDVQKAIWDKVHATPKNPMKIEFDPKTGK